MFSCECEKPGARRHQAQLRPQGTLRRYRPGACDVMLKRRFGWMLESWRFPKFQGPCSIKRLSGNEQSNNSENLSGQEGWFTQAAFLARSRTFIPSLGLKDIAG